MKKKQDEKNNRKKNNNNTIKLINKEGTEKERKVIKNKDKHE